MIGWLEGLAEGIRTGWAIARDLAVGSYRSVRYNFGLAMFSVGIAFVIWIFVTDAENPKVTGTVSDVPVVAVNVPEGLVAPDTLGSVRVSVRTREGVLEELNPSDFEATADLSGFDESTALANVSVTVIERGDDVRVTGVSPNPISVTLEQEIRRTLPVSVEVTSDPPVGFEVNGEPSVDPAEVEIAGHPDLVDRVAQVVAVVSLSGATADIEELETRVIALASSGQQIAGVQINPSEVRVAVDIEQSLYERLIEVVPVITGAPAAGYRVTSVRVEPISGEAPFNVVRAQGSLQTLDSVRQLTTEPIDITGARSDVVRTAAINPVPNLLLATDTVTVTVTIEPQVGQQQFAIVPQVIGLGEGLVARILDSNVLVTLEGALPDLNQIDPGDIDTTVDASGLGVGTHTLVVNATSPSPDLTVEQVNPTEVQVVISQPSPLLLQVPASDPGGPDEQ